MVETRATSSRADRRSGEGRRGRPRALVLPQTLSVQHLAELTDKNPIDVIKQLMRAGVFASINQVIDFETAAMVSRTFGYHAKQMEKTK